MYHQSEFFNAPDPSFIFDPLNPDNIDKKLIENNNYLAKAFEHQCNENFDSAIFELETAWSNLEFLIEHADKQPNTRAMIKDHREIIPTDEAQHFFTEADVKFNLYAFSRDVVQGLLDPSSKKFERVKQKKNPWTEEEHQKFLEGIETYGKDFKKVAALIKTRSVVQVRSHHQKYMLKIEKNTINFDQNLFTPNFSFIKNE